LPVAKPTQHHNPLKSSSTRLTTFHSGPCLVLMPSIGWTHSLEPMFS